MTLTSNRPSKQRQWLWKELLLLTAAYIFIYSGEASQEAASPVLVPPLLLTSSVGGNVTLHCNVTKWSETLFGAARYFWYREDSVIIRNGNVIATDTTRFTMAPDGSLTISFLRFADSGEYRCKVKSSLRRRVVRSGLTSLNVQGAAVLSPNKNQSVFAGETIRLYCSASGNPKPEIVWTSVRIGPKDQPAGAIIRRYNYAWSVFKLENPRARQEGDSLVIRDVRLGDGQGRFTCIAKNSIGGDHEAAYFTIKEAEPPHISKPSRQITHYHINPTHQSEVSYLCRASGKPSPSIKWNVTFYKDGVPVKHFNTEISEGRAQVNLFTFQFTHAELRCLATNMAGQDRKLVIVKTGFGMRNTTMRKGSGSEGNEKSDLMDDGENGSPINGVHRSTRSPEIFNVTNHMTVNAGDNLTLLCQARGSPLPEIDWSKSDKDDDRTKALQKILRRLGQSETDPSSVQRKNLPEGRVVLGQGVVQVVRVVEQDAGVYSCVAVNTWGTSTETVNVTVYTPPRIVLPSPVSGLYLPPNKRKTVRFKCKAKGLPLPMVQWRTTLDFSKGSRQHVLQDWEEQESTLEMSIDNPDLRDMWFECVARNKLGQASTWMNLTRVNPKSSNTIESTQATVVTTVETAPAQAVSHGNQSGILATLTSVPVAVSTLLCIFLLSMAAVLICYVRCKRPLKIKAVQHKHDGIPSVQLAALTTPTQPISSSPQVPRYVDMSTQPISSFPQLPQDVDTSSHPDRAAQRFKQHKSL